MKLKLDAEGHVVVSNGMPVYVGDDEKDVEVDVPKLFGKVAELQGENKTRREKATELEKTLKIFDGIEDLAVFKENADKAIVTVKNYTDKDLVEAGKVEEIKNSMKLAHDEEKTMLLKGFQEKEKGFTDTIGSKDNVIYSLMVSSKFAQSPFFAGEKAKTLLPPEIAETYFGKHFKVEEDSKSKKLRVNGYIDGQPIYSKKMPGELADFDEALDTVIEHYPKKDDILRAGQGGSGAGGGGDGGGGKANTTIEKLQEQHAEATKAGDARLAISLKNKIWALKQKEVQK